MDIAKILKDARDKLGLTQQELADMLGVTDRAISNWENGKRLPDYTLLPSLCDKLNISIDTLFNHENEIEKYYKDKINKIIYALNILIFVMFGLILIEFNYIYVGIIGVSLIIYLYLYIDFKSIKKYKKTIGTIVSVKHLYFIKINKKMFRTHLYKDSYFPLYVKISYSVNGTKYIKSKVIFKEMKLEKGSKTYIVYNEDRPKLIKIL